MKQQQQQQASNGSTYRELLTPVVRLWQSAASERAVAPTNFRRALFMSEIALASKLRGEIANWSCSHEEWSCCYCRRSALLALSLSLHLCRAKRFLRISPIDLFFFRILSFSLFFVHQFIILARLWKIQQCYGRVTSILSSYRWVWSDIIDKRNFTFAKRIFYRQTLFIAIFELRSKAKKKEEARHREVDDATH